MDIFAKITGVKYTPLLCSKLKSFSYKDEGCAYKRYSDIALWSYS